MNNEKEKEVNENTENKDTPTDQIMEVLNNINTRLDQFEINLNALKSTNETQSKEENTQNETTSNNKEETQEQKEDKQEKEEQMSQDEFDEIHKMLSTD